MTRTTARPCPPARRAGLTLLAAGVALGLAGCSGSSAPSGEGAGVRPTASAAAPPGLPTPSASLPPEAAATQGGKYYAVFLAVATDVHDQTLVAAQDRARRLGYSGGVGELTCTPGAREQLKLPAAATYTAFSILFAKKEQAEEFVRAYRSSGGDSVDSDVVGTAYVTAGCLD